MIKKIFYCLYVHKSNIEEMLKLIQEEDIKDKIKNQISIFENQNYKFEVIKYDSRNKRLSLIESDDWNESNEPNVGNGYCIDLNTGINKYIKGKGQVYHNKWMLVSEDYDGFDIEKSKKRSDLCNSITIIKENKIKIGYKEYWENLLKKNGIDL